MQPPEIPKTLLVSYATKQFETVRAELVASAKNFGIANILSYTREDLEQSDYYRENKGILDEVCGGGYWAWKPWVISEALKQIGDGEILIYADAGSMFVGSPEPLLEICGRQPHGIVAFDCRPLKNRQFTKRDCFIKLGCDALPYWDAWETMATLLVIRKVPFAENFVNEWLGWCKDREALTDDPNVRGENLDGYLQHRWDQAILSVLVAKRGIETYRNPTMWGNYLKMPGFRMKGERVTSPYGLPPPIHRYARKPQLNSPYGTLFEINRAPNTVGKQPMPPAAYAERWRDKYLSVGSLLGISRRVVAKIARVVGLR